MRILLLGAGGFIGRHILAELVRHGHHVTAVVRANAGFGMAFRETSFLVTNLARAINEDDWTHRLAGIDAIVNAAGVLRGREMRAVHVDMPRALYAAAEHTGVRRLVLISAISARPEVPTDYAQSKLAGEALVRASGLDWTILRPSLVYGDGSYGGTSLMRGLAGLPWLVPLPGKGDFAFTPIHTRDLARTARLVCEEARFTGQTLEPVGPETISLKDLLTRYRAWLGFGRARFLPIPMPVMRALGRIGDLAGSGPVATNSLAQMIAGNAGNSTAFAAAVGFAPRSLDKALSERPAQVQDRWHARLFFLPPVVKAILVLLWLASALLGLFHGDAPTADLVRAMGLPPAVAGPLRIGSSILDIGIAALLLADRRGHWSTLAQFAVVFGYTVAIGVTMPGLWLDPMGPLLKNLPILALILVHGAIGSRR